MELFYKVFIAILVIIAFIYMPIQLALIAIILLPVLIILSTFISTAIIPLTKFLPIPITLMLTGVIDYLVLLLAYKSVGIFFSPDGTIFFPYCVIFIITNMLYRANRENGKDNRLEYYPLIGFIVAFVLSLYGHII